MIKVKKFASQQAMENYFKGHAIAGIIGVVEEEGRTVAMYHTNPMNGQNETVPNYVPDSPFGPTPVPPTPVTHEYIQELIHTGDENLLFNNLAFILPVGYEWDVDYGDNDLWHLTVVKETIPYMEEEMTIYKVISTNHEGVEPFYTTNVVSPIDENMPCFMLMPEFDTIENFISDFTPAIEDGVVYRCKNTDIELDVELIKVFHVEGIYVDYQNINWVNDKYINDPDFCYDAYSVLDGDKYYNDRLGNYYLEIVDLVDNNGDHHYYYWDDDESEYMLIDDSGADDIAKKYAVQSGDYYDYAGYKNTQTFDETPEADKEYLQNDGAYKLGNVQLPVSIEDLGNLYAWFCVPFDGMNDTKTLTAQVPQVGQIELKFIINEGMAYYEVWINGELVFSVEARAQAIPSQSLFNVHDDTTGKDTICYPAIPIVGDGTPEIDQLISAFVYAINTYPEVREDMFILYY